MRFSSRTTATIIEITATTVRWTTARTIDLRIAVQRLDHSRLKVRCVGYPDRVARPPRWRIHRCMARCVVAPDRLGPHADDGRCSHAISMADEPGPGGRG